MATDLRVGAGLAPGAKAYNKNLLPDPGQQQQQQQQQQGKVLGNSNIKNKNNTRTMSGSETPVQHFLDQEEADFKNTLKELDRELSLCLPHNQRADIGYKSSATPVRAIFELPVPVETAGAHVNYRFATDEYDISFGVFFQGHDGKVETVLATSRVDSNYEPISGDITVHRPGTVILLWDNSYSWFTTKTLSYSVHLRNPPSEIADEERKARAWKVLKNASVELTEAKKKETVVRETYDRLSTDVSCLEERIAVLQAELEEKRRELRTTEEDKTVIEETVSLRQSHMLPLSLRALALPALMRIAAYSHPKDQLFLVSHLWRQLYREAKGLNDHPSKTDSE